MSEFLANIRRLVLKSYPTADDRTMETIGVRHFLKILADQTTAVAVGMKDHQTLEEARTAWETYSSLRDDLGRPPRARAAVAIEDTTPKFVTHQEMAKFGDQLTTVFEKKLGKIESILKGMGKKSGQRPQNRADVECYRKYFMLENVH